MPVENLEKPAAELPPQLRSALEAGIDPSELGAMNSGGMGINIPINLSNWRHLTADQQEALAWMHQVAITDGMKWTDVEQATGYDKTTMFRVLKGTYEGSWDKICRAISSFRKLYEKRGKVQANVFADNRLYRQMEWILDYTLASNGCTMILGESGVGKTACAKEWQRRNNHGRTVLVEGLPIGGAHSLLRSIARAVGVNCSVSSSQMLDSVIRAFNPNRVLIVDEIQHYLPTAGKHPIALEMIRRIRDISGCSLAYLGTVRVRQQLKESGNAYMYEQITGRTSKPFILTDTLTEDDVLPIVRQYVAKPSDKLKEVLVAWANDRDLGRLRYVVEALRFGSRLASDQKQELNEKHIFAGHTLRERQQFGGAR